MIPSEILNKARDDSHNPNYISEEVANALWDFPLNDKTAIGDLLYIVAALVESAYRIEVRDKWRDKFDELELK